MAHQNRSQLSETFETKYYLCTSCGKFPDLPLTIGYLARASLQAYALNLHFPTSNFEVPKVSKIAALFQLNAHLFMISI